MVCGSGKKGDEKCQRDPNGHPAIEPSNVIPRRDLLRWMMVSLTGMALADLSMLEASAGTLPQALPDEFLKRASALDYDLSKLWVAFSRVKESYQSRDLASLWSISAVPLLVLDKGRRFEVQSLSQLRRLAPIVFAAKIRDA